MNPKCTLPEKKRAEALEALSDWGLSVEEEESIRELFPQYLFFRNEYRDDGWNVSSDPVRICTCTACGRSFEAVRGNYARGKLHHEKCNCPQCGREVEGIAANKYKYDLRSLERWVKVAIARAGDDGDLLIQAGNARRQFNHDALTGEVEFWPEKKYFFGKSGACEWKIRTEWEGCCKVGESWTETKTVGDPFQPNMMGWCDYNGEYTVIGLADALPETDLKYCQIMEFYEQYMGCSGGRPVNGVMKYLGWACIHPQIEMAVKTGLSGAVLELVTEGRKNAKLLNWNAKNPAGFLRMSTQEAKSFLREEMDFNDLKDWKGFPDMKLKQYIEIRETVGSRKDMRQLMECCRKAGVTAKQGSNYFRSLQPDCARYAVPAERILREWNDYLDMALRLGYDLSEKTVAMPKNLQERHDQAAETITVRRNQEELKKYRTRRKQLEKKYAFRMGEYCILVPNGSEEIVREGKTLHHCVGGYAARHIEGKTTILFLRKARTPGRSFLTIELYEDRGKIGIRQIHGYRNEHYDGATAPEKRFDWFLGPWLEWVNGGSERDRSGNPVLPGTEAITTEVKTA